MIFMWGVIFTSSFKANSSSGDKIGEGGEEDSGDSRASSSFRVDVLKKEFIVSNFVVLCLLFFLIELLTLL